MATRPVFVPSAGTPVFCKEADVEFEWHPGFSDKQKRRSIDSLHAAAARQHGIENILEISSKSASSLGQQLSAFNLHISKNPLVSVESAYQGSKVFKQGGPFPDLYDASSRDAKKDERLRTSGELTAFDLKGDRWPLQPKTAFYDWLYLKALKQHSGLVEELLSYGGFTDIEFNPKKSVNCQARAAALGVALHQKGLFDEVLSSKRAYLSLRRDEAVEESRKRSDSVPTNGPKQGDFFE